MTLGFAWIGFAISLLMQLAEKEGIREGTDQLDRV
jgi:hypothetical protein